MSLVCVCVCVRVTCVLCSQDEKKREGIAKALLAATEGGERAVSLGGVGGTRALGQGGAPQASKGTFVGSNKIVYRHLRVSSLSHTHTHTHIHTL